MNILYKWALGFFVFSFAMGWSAAHNTGDVQAFFAIFSFIGFAASVALTMTAYIDLK